MICDYCDERIYDEATIVDLRSNGKLYFCDTDCKDMYLDNCTINQVLDEELDELEDAYYDFK